MTDITQEQIAAQILADSCMSDTVDEWHRKTAADMLEQLAADNARLRAAQNPPERYCAKCGAPESNHPYRHPFVALEPAPDARTYEDGLRDAAKVADECRKQNGPLSRKGFDENYRKGLEAGGQAIAAAIRALLTEKDDD